MSTGASSSTPTPGVAESMADRIVYPPPPPPPTRRRLTLPSLPAFGTWTATNWLLLVIVLVMAYDHRSVPGDIWATLTEIPEIRAGTLYRDSLGSSEGDGFEAAAVVVENGGGMADASAALQATALAERQAAFSKLYAAPFNALVPSGDQPKDQETRDKLAALFRAYKTGLKRRHWWL